MALNLSDPPEGTPERPSRTREEGLHEALRSAIETLAIVYQELAEAHRTLAAEYRRGVNDGRKIEQRVKRRRKPRAAPLALHTIGLLAATGLAIACSGECPKRTEPLTNAMSLGGHDAYFEEIVVGCPIANKNHVL